MGHGNDHAGEVQQEILQPVDGLNIQVIGGLVQHNDLRVAEQCLCQQHLHFQTGVGGAHVVVVHFGGDTQTLQHTGGIGFGFPSTHLRKLHFQLRGADAVFVGEVLLLVDGILFLHNIIKMAVAHDDSIHDGILIVGVLVLLQHGDTLPFRNGDGTGGGIQFAGEQPQESGLACAVGTDNAIAVTGEELQVNVLEQPLAAELHT